MSAIILALLYGFFFVKTFHDVIAMGVLLGHGRCQLRRRALARFRLVPPGVQGPRHGHRRCRQQRHGTRRALCTAPCHPLRLATRVRLCCRLHGTAAARHGLFRQRTARHRAPDAQGTPRLPHGKGRLVLQPRLHHHLRRLHRPGHLPAHLLRQPVPYDQGPGRHLHRLRHAHRQLHACPRRLLCRQGRRHYHALRRPFSSPLPASSASWPRLRSSSPPPCLCSASPRSAQATAPPSRWCRSAGPSPPPSPAA